MTKKKKFKFKLNNLASYIVIFAGLFALLNYFESFFKPLIVALIIWYIVRELSRQIEKVKIKDKVMPYWLRSMISFLVIIGFLYSAVHLFILNFDQLQTNLPKYTNSINSLITDLESFSGINISERFTIQNMDIRGFITSTLSGLTAFFSSSTLIILYVIFLMAEERAINRKVHHLSKNSSNSAKIFDIIGRINRAIHGYITVKFFTSLLTGLLSYGVLVLLDVDLAGLWAFLIFLMNFIPNIGSILATLFPAIFAMLQYSSFANFFFVLFAVGGIQLLIGNVLEPRFMGNRLNLSPFVILLSLFFWGYIWGIIGMLLSVPITVSLMIVCASFPKTRPLAIMLSQTGEVEVIEQILEGDGEDETQPTLKKAG